MHSQCQRSDKSLQNESIECTVYTFRKMDTATAFLCVSIMLWWCWNVTQYFNVQKQVNSKKIASIMSTNGKWRKCFCNRLQTWCLVSVTFDKRWMIIHMLINWSINCAQRMNVINFGETRRKRNRKLCEKKLYSSLIKLIQLESRLFWNKVYIPSSECHFDEYEKWMANKVFQMQISLTK